MITNKKVAVIGQGYVGLPLSLELVSAGYTVYGIDNDESRILELKQGRSYIDGVDQSNLTNALESNKFLPTSEFSKVQLVTTVVICVPTPLLLGKPDTSKLESAVQSIRHFVQPKTLVINESTSYPGTLRNIIAPLFGKDKVKLLHFAIAPERINPGQSAIKYREIPRILSGLTYDSTELAKSFYESIGTKAIVVSSPEVAEYAKLLENAFRFVNIALINELAMLTAKTGVDIHEVINAANSKPFGFMAFQPGIGVGGHCIPVDPIYLKYYAELNNFSLEAIEFSQKINAGMTDYCIQRIEGLVGPNKKILVYGVSYKYGVEDIRESPSLELMHQLSLRGHTVFFLDDLIEGLDGYGRATKNLSYDLMVYVHGKRYLNDYQNDQIVKKILDCAGNLPSSNMIHKLFSLR